MAPSMVPCVSLGVPKCAPQAFFFGAWTMAVMAQPHIFDHLTSHVRMTNPISMKTGSSRFQLHTCYVIYKLKSEFLDALVMAPSVVPWASLIVPKCAPEAFFRCLDYGGHGATARIWTPDITLGLDDFDIYDSFRCFWKISDLIFISAR